MPFRSDLVVPQWHEHGWSVFVVPLPVGIVIGQAGTYRFVLVTEHQDIGTLQVILVDPPILTEERVAAIRSDPNAIKGVRINLECQKCASNLMVYAGLERMQSLEDEGYRWHQDIPDDFRCECGSTKLDLRSMKKNLFAAIGQKMPLAVPDQSSFVPLYEHAAFEKVKSNFSKLLDKSPDEEVIQKFIEGNLVLLHLFPAVNIFFKPSLLNLYKADFAIVTTGKELILIEIEKVSTRLLKADGGIAAPLSHAFDQVRNWLHVVDDHRLAVLDGLKISRDLVGIVRGVVIAGRDRGQDAEHLRRLKADFRTRVSFLTFDDLAHSLGALSRQVSAL